MKLQVLMVLSQIYILMSKSVYLQLNVTPLVMNASELLKINVHRVQWAIKLIKKVIKDKVNA